MASGYVLDRVPARRIMLGGLAAIVLALAYIPFISSLWELIAVYVVFAIGLATGGLLPSMVILTRWFVRYRGIAVGLLLLAASVGGAIFPAFVGGMLETSGWRQTVLFLAGVGGGLMLAPILFLVRSHPRDMNLRADGAVETAGDIGAAQPYGGPTVADAIASPVTYLLIFTTATLWLCITGVLQHQALYLGSDLGVAPPALGYVFSIFFFASGCGYVLFGYLSDRFAKSHILMLAVANLGLGLGLLRMLNADNTALMYVYAVVFGIGFSGAFSMVQLIVAEYFAGDDYGTILGAFVFIDTLASSLGISLLGNMRVAFGSYLPAIDMMIALCIVSLGCVAVIMRLSVPGQPTAAPAPGER